jgi:hypothetical protein
VADRKITVWVQVKADTAAYEQAMARMAPPGSTAQRGGFGAGATPPAAPGQIFTPGTGQGVQAPSGTIYQPETVQQILAAGRDIVKAGFVSSADYNFLVNQAGVPSGGSAAGGGGGGGRRTPPGGGGGGGGGGQAPPPSSGGGVPPGGSGAGRGGVPPPGFTSWDDYYEYLDKTNTRRRRSAAARPNPNRYDWPDEDYIETQAANEVNRDRRRASVRHAKRDIDPEAYGPMSVDREAARSQAARERRVMVEERRREMMGLDPVSDRERNRMLGLPPPEDADKPSGMWETIKDIAYRRLGGGRPRGLAGLFGSLAGASLIAGAAARSIRHNYEGMAEGSVSPDDIALNAGERIPILGEGIQLARQAYGNSIERMETARYWRESRQLGELRQSMQFNIANRNQGIQNAQFAAMQPLTEARVAQGIYDQVRNNGRSFVNPSAQTGVASGQEGEIAFQVAATGERVKGSVNEQQRTQELVDKGKERLDIVEFRAKDLAISESTLKQEVRRVDDYLAGGFFRRENAFGAEQRRRLSDVSESAKDAAQKAADAKRAQERNEVEHGEARRRHAENVAAHEEAVLMKDKGNRLNILKAMEGQTKASNLSLTMMAPGVRQQWLSSVNKLVSGDAARLNPVDWELLFMVPMSRERAEKVAGDRTDMPEFQAAAKALGWDPAGQQGAGAQREGWRKLEQEVNEARARIMANEKKAQSEIATDMAKMLTNTLMEVFKKVNENLLREFGIVKGQAKVEANNRAGGGG